MSGRTLTSIVVAAVLSILLAGAIQAYQTKRLFVVSVDGIRDHEAFAYEFEPGDSVHPYMPFIWDTLKPQGTAYLEMYNEVFTFTSPGHQTILTGDWHIMPNLQAEELRYQTRPWSPTIFEYARKDLHIPRSKVWCVVGKLNCVESNWSLNPAYGSNYGANLVQYPEELVPETDSLTVDALMEVLDAHEPSIVFVNLQGVDVAGHAGVYEDYLESIRLADRAVERIWERINADSVYLDKTTLILTTDHGRHDDGLGGPLKGGFQSHGGVCHGCRHIMFLAVGPDTPVGLEVTRRAYQIDIAPTIGELLTFETPLSRGQILREAIVDYSEPDRLIRKEPAVDIDGGKVFITWSDNRTGNDEVYFLSSLDSARTFGDTLQLSNSSVSAIQPDIAVDDSVVHLVWIDYRNENWELYYRRSVDYGLSWEDARILISSIPEDEYRARAFMLWDPSIQVEENRCMITISGHRDWINALLSDNDGETWYADVIHNSAFYPAYVKGTIFGFRVGVAWCDQSWSEPPYRNWDVKFNRGSYPGGNWGISRQISDNSTYSIQPVIASNNLQDVGIAWADDKFDSFQIFFRESRDGGMFWFPRENVSNSPKGAWQPSLSWDRATENVHLVWTDYRDERAEIYHSYYDGYSWSENERLTSTYGFVNLPDMAIDDDGNSFFVWEIVANDEVSIGMGDLLGP